MFLSNSWERAIKCRFKNIRKAKPQGTKRCTPQKNEEIRPKKLKKDEVGRISEKLDGETLETCKGHVSVMRKEMFGYTNRKLSIIKKLMELTFPFRRERILMEPAAAKSILKEYPAFNLLSEVSYDCLQSKL